jgi:hypothetical protein
MGIKEDSVNIQFTWLKASKKTKAFIIIVVVFALSLIRFSYSTVYIGYFAGECGKGRCHTEYQIDSDRLIINHTSEDTASNVHKVINGDFNDLKFKAPLLLLSNPTGRFGCPDCTDGGGFILGFKFFWIDFKFSFDRSSEPWYFKGMSDIVKDRMQRIEKIEAASSKN